MSSSISSTTMGRARAALQCAQVAQLMAPCMPYLTGAPGMTPYGICCNCLGVLNQLAATPADRVAACRCVKAAAGGVPVRRLRARRGAPRRLRALHQLRHLTQHGLHPVRTHATPPAAYSFPSSRHQFVLPSTIDVLACRVTEEEP
ncbi:hypothetical protein C2845_PM08G01300 [Panicum miliaceum]|uniref:Bifunctional inhibitor/plant lipid transfer protein/seed storage helical domain-containing protein n=1 Tax=Panicum miliaceum TaxID=4540 RepID=A0A3L6R4L6_PANMI|nr:hypothetical protein C2845_PM08G01300 [Panicum miliaceum]